MEGISNLHFVHFWHDAAMGPYFDHESASYREYVLARVAYNKVQYNRWRIATLVQKHEDFRRAGRVRSLLLKRQMPLQFQVACHARSHAEWQDFVTLQWRCVRDLGHFAP